MQNVSEYMLVLAVCLDMRMKVCVCVCVKNISTQWVQYLEKQWTKTSKRIKNLCWQAKELRFVVIYYYSA